MSMEPVPELPRRRGRRRGRVLAVVLVVVAAGGAAAFVLLGRGEAEESGEPDAGLPPSTAEVARQTLRDTLEVDGELGYGTTTTVTNRIAGTITALPDSGTSSYVPVRTGLFADGLVEVSGDGIAEGTVVGMPA